MLAVEAEYFHRHTHTGTRKFYPVSIDNTPSVQPDGDPPHIAGTSGGAYVEILPDTRRTHDDKLIRGENFAPVAGEMAILHYDVEISTPGRYYVWVRAFSTGTEDNGLHVGLDGEWPESGQRLQWCEGKHSWRWESKQRTEKQHCGEPYKIFLDIEDAGRHTIAFSMREDGFEFDKWLITNEREFDRPEGPGPPTIVRVDGRLKALPVPPTIALGQTDAPAMSPTKGVSDLPLILPRREDGDGSVDVSGDMMTWHKITLTIDGPFAHEQDNAPNPFTDHRMAVEFKHEDGTRYVIPGYFATDGEAAESSADSGTKWRAHFAPDRPGQWNYTIRFSTGKHAALDDNASSRELPKFSGRRGKFDVAKSDKNGRDLRGHGRLQYVGKRYLQHAGSKHFFLKAGADAPETLLAFADFDGTVANKPDKSPLKTWTPHVRDWSDGDPTWGDGKGKGLIGAVNYLSGKGCNAFSFLTYNAGGDGDNVWPFIDRDDKLHYDCSKLDQWGIVFDHATMRGMYLHFKMQETENDDHIRGKNGGFVPTSLDGGNLGTQRKLYCRELIARFAHNLALNWNLGEENTQTTEQQKAMINYIDAVDAYDHPIVIHTFPDQQDKVYRPLLGSKSKLTGVSLQNSALKDTHLQTVKWVRESAAAGKPWVVAFDESGSAAHGQCPDLGYRGFDGRDRTGKMIYDQHAVRRQTLWGTLMGGGAGNEYYFGYQFDENDLVCEDWRSRDQSWDYCRIALEFFRDQKIPIEETKPADNLIGNPSHDNSKYCLANPGELYLVYLPNGGETELDLSDADGTFNQSWLNPRSGEMTDGTEITGGATVTIAAPPKNDDDWLVVLRRKS